MGTKKQTSLKINEEHIQFEEIVLEIFKEAGYEITAEVIPSNDSYCDFVASMDSEKYFVETKYLVNKIAAIPNCLRYRMSILAEHVRGEGKATLVVAGVVDEVARKDLLDDDIVILDLTNLLWAVSGHTRIRNRLVSLLPYSIDGTECVEPDISLSWISHSDENKNLLDELNDCRPGKADATKYEHLCTSLLQSIFVDDLSLWKIQKRSNKDLYRFDLLCRLKIDNKGAFWHIIEHSFHSNYIIFEFKNYRNKITQNEIYTTERYLFAKALRTVAIMVTTFGADKNAKWAAKGCLRENGKLIIILDKNDIIKMLEMKNDGEDPSNHLLSLLDEMLLDLEK